MAFFNLCLKLYRQLKKTLSQDLFQYLKKRITVRRIIVLDTLMPYLSIRSVVAVGAAFFNYLIKAERKKF